MAGVKTKLGRVWVKNESVPGVPESSFDETDGISCEVAVPQLMEEAIVIATLKGSFAADEVMKGSRINSTITITHKLQGNKKTTPTATPTAHPDAILMASVLGGSASYGYKTLHGSGQTVSALTFPDTNIDASASGFPFLVPCTAAASGRAFAWAKTFVGGATEVITPWNNLPGAATNSGQTFGAYVAYLTIADSEPFTTKWALGQGNGDASVIFTSCVVTEAAITFQDRQPISVTYTIKCADWNFAGSWVPTPYVVDYYPHMGVLNKATGALLNTKPAGGFPSQVEVSISNVVVDLPDFGGFAGWSTADRTVTVTITETVDDYLTRASPGDLLSNFQLDASTVPGRALSVFMPAPQVSVAPDDADGSGLVTRKTTLNARSDFSETAGGIAGSEFRIAFA